MKEIGEPEGKLADKYDKKAAKKAESMAKELLRLKGMTFMEAEARELGYRFIGGIDEAGRGPLAGPVVAACVILPEDYFPEGLNDSKKVSPKKRDSLYDEIKKNALAYGIGIVENGLIDEINILNATKKAMEIAVGAMKVRPDYLILDAVRLNLALPQKSVPKADANSLTVAAASILAKVTRDRLMDRLDDKYPGYGFLKHKGYGTSEHMDAIRALGLSPIHRRSFTKKLLQSVAE